MDEDFMLWHIEKDSINKAKQRPYFHEREVWFASLGINIGFEQNGKGSHFLRPVLIFKKFNNEVCWGLPLTRTSKKGRYYFSFNLKDTVSSAILSQIRLLDGKRLEYKVGDMQKEDFISLKNKFINIIT